MKTEPDALKPPEVRCRPLAGATPRRAGGGASPGLRPRRSRARTAVGAYIDPGLPSIHPFDLAMPPFFLKSASEFRPAGSPPLTGERYARDLDEVRRLGVKTGTERSAADFWRGG